MDEYEQLGHLENIPAEHLDDKPHWYIPHHAIMQTKLRVVFDGSCGSPSLNECLHPGAKLQLDISAVILRWRLLRFGFTSEIVKMYRQIRIHPEDTDWLRIVMRTSPDQALADKCLLTLTYGTSCAPFQTLRTLLQLAEDEGAELPLGADMVRKHIYVDDAYAGGDTLEEARAVRNQFVEILRRAGMSLDKWAANTRELLPEPVSSSSEHIFDPENTVSTFELKWTPHFDEFSFAVRDPLEHNVITKRIVLSEIARSHDLFRLIAPVTVRAKMLLQMLWLSGKDWDSPILESLQEQWIEYRRQFVELRSLRIPRWCGTDITLDWIVVGFSDASERTYAAAVYLAFRGRDHRLYSHLVASKSKVAPIKSLSVSRLELCGAVILAKLIVHVVNTLPRKPSSMHCSTDSEIVLAWLRKPPSTWHTFVANRVSNIITLLPDVTWKPVRSSDNPADLATRGMTPQELICSELWWHGPAALLGETAERDSQEYETTLERKNEVAIFNIPPGDIEDIIDRFSIFGRMLRVISYARRLLINSRLPAAARPPLALNSTEIDHTLHTLIKAVQQHHFGNELQRLRNGQVCPRNSRLRPLLPFLDEDGVMRVGGRLQYSQLNNDEKHPIIVPPQSHFAELLIRLAHSATLHGGPQLMHIYIIRRY